MSLVLENLELPRDNFTLRLEGEIGDDVTGVFGPSGAGKTSLMHLLAGLVRPTSGRIVFNGRTLVDVARGVWVPPHCRRIGMVFQEARLFPHLTVKGNLLFGQRYHPTGRAWFDEVVALLELEKLLSSVPGCISGGEAQRVALGRALLCGPELLLLDEPFSAVDTGLRRQILPFLWRIRAHWRIPLLVISHDLPDILQLTPHLLLIEQGRVIGHGPVAELICDERSAGLVKGSGIVSVFDLTVTGIEDGDTVVLTPPGGEFSLCAVSTPGLKPGIRVKASISPEDVLLGIAPVTGTSARNMLRGRIVRVVESPARSLCQVDLGGGHILIAELTQNSFQRLALTPGMDIHCVFKATVIDVTPVNG